MGICTLTPPPPAGVISAVSWIGTGSALVYVKSNSLAQFTAGRSVRPIRQEVASGRLRTLSVLSDMAASVYVFGDGRLLLGSTSQRTNLREVTLAAAGRTASARWLTHGNSVDRQPTFSPDGEWVLFSSNRSGNLDLWEDSHDDRGRAADHRGRGGRLGPRLHPGRPADPVELGP